MRAAVDVVQVSDHSHTRGEIHCIDDSLHRVFCSTLVGNSFTLLSTQFGTRHLIAGKILDQKLCHTEQRTGIIMELIMESQ